MAHLVKKIIRKLILILPVLRTATPSNVKIVLASDLTHFNSLIRLLDSLSKYTDINIVLYNLGLTETSLYKIREYGNVKIVDFDFEIFHKFVRNLKSFAWKPQIIQIEAQGFEGVLIYMDAGNLLKGNLNLLIKYVIKYNFISTFSTGVLRDFTSPLSLEKLGVDSEDLDYRNLNGAFLGFHTANLEIMKLLDLWSYSSLDEQTIAPVIPEGVTHRYDQSLLTFFANRFKLVDKAIARINTLDFNVLIHQDID